MDVIRVVDVETTGLDPMTHAVVELAYCDVIVEEDGTSSLLDATYSTLVNPGKPIPPEASAIHHLTDDDVNGARELARAVSDLSHGGGCAPTALCAHNASFDKSFLELPEGQFEWICTKKASQRIWPDAPGHSNQVLRYWLKLEVDSHAKEIMPHRALHDCLVTAALLMALLQHASLDELIAWEKEPVLLHRMPFGKYRGRLCAYVPKDYWDWCLRQDFEADVLHTAKYWLTNSH